MLNELDKFEFQGREDNYSLGVVLREITLQVEAQ